MGTTNSHNGSRYNVIAYDKCRARKFGCAFFQLFTPNHPRNVAYLLLLRSAVVAQVKSKDHQMLDVPKVFLSSMSSLFHS